MVLIDGLPRETRDGSFLFQRLSVLIQRFNAVLNDNKSF